MARIQGLVDTVVYTADTQITTVETYVFSVDVSWIGGTVGEHVWLKNTATGTDVKRVAVVKSTANGVTQMHWPQGRHFPAGLYLDIGAATGQVFVSIQYKT